MNNRKYWGNNASQKTTHQASDVIKAETTKKVEEVTPEKKDY
ncbi:hypothetical protein [endosymbiont 'TC1' of Trimyema compressum]|nr:hypothetical protein [endosymbiont 'TC1' of Trimyema compressum]